MKLANIATKTKNKTQIAQTMTILRENTDSIKERNLLIFICIRLSLIGTAFVSMPPYSLPVRLIARVYDDVHYICENKSDAADKSCQQNKRLYGWNVTGTR